LVQGIIVGIVIRQGKNKERSHTPWNKIQQEIKVKRKNALRDIEGKERVIINHRGLLGRTP
jgi:hypothetical protein